MVSPASPLRIEPWDTANQSLIANVHPADWRNPEPVARYNLVVVGAGTAGLVTASVAAGLGAKVALVERHAMGGDCLNVGCVPSKAIIASGRRVAEARAAAALGLKLAGNPACPDFGAAMQRMREVRARISPHDSVARYQGELGVDVFLGDARFSAPDRVVVGARELRFRRAAIATGARAAAPPIPGLEAVGFLTNETVFSLTSAPPRLAVIGGGPIGCELAQAFQRLGSRVALLEASDQVLVREDRDAAAVVETALLKDGVALHTGVQIDQVDRVAEGKRIGFSNPTGPSEALIVDEILVAAGRAPNVESLGLEAAGVEFDPRQGVRVNDFLRTRNRRIYALGDCAMEWKFTHAADAAAKIVVQNALFLGRKRLSNLVMPWCTYTDPEIGHIGLYERDAAERGISIDTYRVDLEQNDRALCDGQEAGFIKILTRRGRDEILGATVVAAHAGDLIGALSIAMAGKLGLGAIANAIFPYPTQAEAIKATANAYLRTRLTPRIKTVFETFLRWRR